MSIRDRSLGLAGQSLTDGWADSDAGGYVDEKGRIRGGKDDRVAGTSVENSRGVRYEETCRAENEGARVRGRRGRRGRDGDGDGDVDGVDGVSVDAMKWWWLQIIRATLW